MKKVNENKRVLFICTHNSARSQVAEGLLKSLFSERFKAYSAGIEPGGVNSYAIKVMSEIGIDISAYRSKSIEEFRDMKFDYVTTVCDHAKETCPFFPGAGKYIHMGFDDPSGFDGNEDEKLAVFRRVRDEIKDWIEITFSEEGKANGA